MSSKHLMRQRDIAAGLRTFSHPWNPKSEMRGAQLGAAMGFRRIGVNFIRLSPGKEAYTPHAHAREEEWVFILEGRGRARIGEEMFEIGPGDFLAFPAPQVVHHIANAGKTDLVCLMGGEVLPLDVVDFPDQRKRMVWVEGKATAYDLAAGEDPFSPKALVEPDLFDVPKSERSSPRQHVGDTLHAKSKAPVKTSVKTSLKAPGKARVKAGAKARRAPAASSKSPVKAARPAPRRAKGR